MQFFTTEPPVKPENQLYFNITFFNENKIYWGKREQGAKIAVSQQPPHHNVESNEALMLGPYPLLATPIQHGKLLTSTLLTLKLLSSLVEPIWKLFWSETLPT